MMYDASLGGCAAKRGKGGDGQVDMNLTCASSPYQGVPNETSLRVSCHEKGAVAKFDVEAT
jgi:hypothetical protein